MLHDQYASISKQGDSTSSSSVQALLGACKNLKRRSYTALYSIRTGQKLSHKTAPRPCPQPCPLHFDPRRRPDHVTRAPAPAALTTGLGWRAVTEVSDGQEMKLSTAHSPRPRHEIRLQHTADQSVTRETGYKPASHYTSSVWVWDNSTGTL